MAIILWNKHYGETLDEMVQRFRLEQPTFETSKITYAGRLDPLAEGLMILLTDDDVHKKDDYNRLDKIYEVDFILGVETDTYDMLGIINHTGTFNEPETLEQDINNLVGIQKQPYPPYASKTVHGKPLWQHAREGTLNDISVPTQEINIFQSEFLGHRVLSLQQFQSEFLEIISKVAGDFRQEEILAGWGEYIARHSRKYCVYTARFKVSSGTYIRGLIHILGQQWGTGAACLKIRRTQIGG